MNATIESTIKRGTRSHSGFALGLGLAIFMVLSTIPVVARTLAGGPQFPGLQIIIPGAVALAGLLFAGYSHARLRRAQRNLAMTAGERSAALLRLERDIAGQQMWFLLVAAVVLPSALLRPAYYSLPAGALITGAILAGLALLQVFRQRNAAEAYWSSLGPAEMKAEIAQAWSQRFVPVLVMLVTVPAYIFLLGFGRDPVTTWFSLPPGPDQAINYVVTFYLLVLVTWVVVNYRNVHEWYAKVRG